jgi:ubiquinone biosynthesis protein
MGPIFIKFGQFLSVRSDLLDPDVLSQLTELCDKVRFSDPEFFIPQLDKLTTDYNIQIDHSPLAAASIAHVYSGVLPCGELVAIKVQRPDLEKILESDLKIIKIILTILAFFAPKRLRLKKVFERFSNTLSQEMNFKREAAQADALKMALKNYTTHCEIPKIYWQYTTETILVLQKAPGIRFQSLLNLQLDRTVSRQIAEKLYNIFLHSVFQHGVFHADLHPGNIFYDFAQERFWFVDFGIVARFEQSTHKLLCRQVIALLERDYVAMAQAFIDGGWTPSHFSLIDQQNFEWSLHMLIAPWMDRKLQEISLAHVLREMLILAQTYKIQVHPEMILLQKTLFVVEGLVRILDPEINLIQAGYYEVTQSVKNRYGVVAKIARIFYPLGKIDIKEYVTF